MRGRSGDVLPLLAKGSFHGAYLDADHSERSVSRDLAQVWDLLLPGAVLVCDDYGSTVHPGARAAVDAYFNKPEILHQVLHRNFQIILLKR
jgi:predicted O-methyltransferase YrrM